MLSLFNYDLLFVGSCPAIFDTVSWPSFQNLRFTLCTESYDFGRFRLAHAANYLAVSASGTPRRSVELKRRAETQSRAQ